MLCLLPLGDICSRFGANLSPPREFLFRILPFRYSQIQVSGDGKWPRRKGLLTQRGKLGCNGGRTTAGQAYSTYGVQARTRRRKVNANEPAVSQEEIARRAYEIWQSRGCPSSDGTDEWQAAEAELTAARVARNGSTQQRMQSWWSRVLKKGKRQETH
jgi:hypothetical protein